MNEYFIYINKLPILEEEEEEEEEVDIWLADTQSQSEFIWLENHTVVVE